MRQLSTVLQTERLPVKVVISGMPSGSWVEIETINSTVGKAYGTDNTGRPYAASLSDTQAELLSTLTRAAAVPHFAAVIKNSSGKYYLSDLVFATIEDARAHYVGKTVVKLATEVPGISLVRAG